MKNVPKKPGKYLQFTSRTGYVKHVPLTKPMADRRDAIAKALGYVLPEKCTLCNIYGDNGRRLDCWERADEHEFKDGKKASSYHQVFGFDLSRYGAPRGAIGYCWPDDVEAAASAIDKRKPLPDESSEETTAETVATEQPRLI